MRNLTGCPKGRSEKPVPQIPPDNFRNLEAMDEKTFDRDCAQRHSIGLFWKFPVQLISGSFYYTERQSSKSSKKKKKNQNPI